SCGAAANRTCSLADYADTAFPSRAAIPPNIRTVLEGAAQGANWSAKPLNRSVAWAVSNSTVEKVGTDQVRIHLSRPYPAFLQSLAFTVGSIVEKACAATWDDWGARNPMLDRRRDCGTGPYGLTGWVPNQAIVLSRFDGYWGSPAALEGVRIEKANDVTAREFLLLSGDADTAVINHDHQFDVMNPDGTPRYPWLRIPSSRPAGGPADVLLEPPCAEGVQLCVRLRGIHGQRDVQDGDSAARPDREGGPGLQHEHAALHVQPHARRVGARTDPLLDLRLQHHLVL